MKVGTAFGAILLLSACSSNAKQAEDDLSFLEQNGAPAADLCQAANKVAAAYRDEHNADRYRFYTLIAAGKCAAAESQSG